MTITLDQIRKDAETKMLKSIDMLKHELAKLRTGRAHPSILDGISVEYYGAATPLMQLASITVTDSRTLTVTPFDKSSIAAIDKAIRNSELGLNPATAGTTIRVPLPPLTEERRLALIKQMKGSAEDARVSIRNVRRDANNQIKTLLKDKVVTEDEERRAQDAVQKVTDKHVGEIDKMVHEKEADLLQI
ncbi:MAG TPA: ribosome recycling factor [Gammaproteobacteria bacterium]|nr:ribosome recycling factor [Gammaproteobacteria bacterium]